MHTKPSLLLLMFGLLFWGCQKPQNNLDNSNRPSIVRKVNIQTDKARYNPGEQVRITIDKEVSGLVRYYFLGSLIEEAPINGKEWLWMPPAEDFCGYLVEIYSPSAKKAMGSIAVDVSSDWTRFPRYGFVSDFELKNESQIRKELDFLTRCHINGLQFYDWLYDHHHPLAGSVQAPDNSWLDIIGRTNYRSTVDAYIDLGHKAGIASMWYDLCYGALRWAEDDGASWQWGAYKDKNHKNLDYHPLSSFRSDIFLMDPNNNDWLNYFSERLTEVFDVYDFDGFHIDQLGYRGTLYDYSGKTIDMPAGYKKFISKMHSTCPDKAYAFNAVSRFGQDKIASAEVDFLYNEVWETEFTEIKTILDENFRFSSGAKNSVLAAYMNYNKNPKSGEFNTPAVLLADAVIFALGGSHLELGPHMLCSEYFPSTALSMSVSLKESIVRYYDFLTAYQNLLRSGTTDAKIGVVSRNSEVEIGTWPPECGKVLAISKKSGNKEIIHLINFKNATHTQWRDDSASQAEPSLIEDLSLRLSATNSANRVWVASPDEQGGCVPQELEVKKVGSFMNVTIPSLKYWTMIVIE